MMAMVSPSSDAFGESLSTLKFATRAKKIKNEARINEDVDQRALLRKYEIELRRLKWELEEKNKVVVDNKHLS
jgi:kinesin family protein 3/17